MQMGKVGRQGSFGVVALQKSRGSGLLAAPLALYGPPQKLLHMSRHVHGVIEVKVSVRIQHRVTHRWVYAVRMRVIDRCWRGTLIHIGRIPTCWVWIGCCKLRHHLFDLRLHVTVHCFREGWGVIFGENLILGSVRVEEQEVIEIANAVGQRANGEVFGCVGHEVPNHSLTCFVRVFCHPGNCDSSDLRVTEAQKEGTVGFGHQHILSLLLVHEAQDGSVIPVRFEMLFCEFHYTIKPLPKCKVPSWQAFPIKL